MSTDTGSKTAPRREGVSSNRNPPLHADSVSSLNLPLTLRIDTNGIPVVEVMHAIVRICGENCFDCVQKWTRHQFMITLKTPEDVNKVLKVGKLQCGDKECQVQRAGANIITVTLHKVMFEISNEVVSAALAPYGKVQSVDFDMESIGSVPNGNRKVIMNMAQPVPNQLNIARQMVTVTYPGVIV